MAPRRKSKRIRGQPEANVRRSAIHLQSGTRAFWQTGVGPWILLAAVTALAYINAGHDVLVLDDRTFLAEGQFEQLSPAAFLDLFSQSLWEASGSQSNLYRPLLLVTFGIETALFGGWAAGYLVFNIALHVLATLLVFGFVRQVFLLLGCDHRAASLSALLGALAFGVHPALTEVVNQVFNGSEIYVTVATAGGLWFLLLNVETHPVRAWLLLGIAYFTALLYRESAVSLPALAVLTVWMTGSGPWTKRLGSCLPALLLIIPLALYLALRANALDPSDGVPRVAETGSVSRTTEQAGLARYEPTLRLFAAAEEARPRETPGSWLDMFGANLEVSRLQLAVSTWYDALRLMVWPHPLVVLREVSVTPFWLALTVQLALLAFALLRLLRGSKAPLLGLSFFYLAILPSSRIVSDSFLPPILMDRMLYLPAIGLTICLAAAFLWLGRVMSPRSSVVAGALAVLILLPVTWTRNEAWGNELTLLEHDFEHEKRNGQLLSSLLKAYSRNGQNARALRLCEQYSATVDATPVLLHDCAGIYSSAGLNGRAESLYLRALELDPSNSWDRFELARLYVRVGRADDARAYFRSAVENEGMAFVREIMQAIALIELYPDDPGRQARATEHLERALALQPRSVHARQLLDQLEGAQRNPRRD